MIGTAVGACPRDQPNFTVLVESPSLTPGHPHPTTIQALAECIPELERENIQLIPASELVRLPEAARLSPPRAHLGSGSVCCSGAL
ncbi:MAG: hypothetical protein DMG22_04850 [Acidobacteria bacterium]|nr:MAG: hypothetical protein DMG22_04850 [Acidobacteriota bacterium]